MHAKEKKAAEKRAKRERKKLLKLQSKIENELHANLPKTVAQFDDLENYIENLYEDNYKCKIEATYHILQLVQNPEYLSHFVENERLIGALSRILQEDMKKQLELTSNILEIFFCFSNFTDLHSILVRSKIGGACMQVIRHELKLSNIHTCTMLEHNHMIGLKFF